MEALPPIYKDRFHNHFENKEFVNPQHYSSQENFLVRYNTVVEHYKSLPNSLTVVFFKTGSGEFIRKNTKLRVSDDKFVVLNQNEGWEYVNHGNKRVDVLSLGISKQCNAEYLYYLKSRKDQLLEQPFDSLEDSYFFLEHPLSSDYYASGKLLKHIYEQSNTYEYQYMSPYELTIDVLRSIYKEQLQGHKISREIDVKKRSTRDETMKRLLKAYEFINDNIENSISTKQLSMVSALSKFHLYDSFRKAFGKTPHQYINTLKITKAKEVLENKNLSVSEVSDAFGYSDLAVFSKVFKKTYGNPPSYYHTKN